MVRIFCPLTLIFTGLLTQMSEMAKVFRSGWMDPATRVIGKTIKLMAEED